MDNNQPEMRGSKRCPPATQAAQGPALTSCFVIHSQTSQGMVEPLPAELRSASESKRHYRRHCRGLEIQVSNL